LLIALALTACSPKTAEPPAPQAVALDCSLSFEALKAKVAGQPGLVAAPKEPGEPYAWYNSADQATSYVVTEPGAPGHPAVVMERAAGGQEAVTGCAYGDKAGYDKLIAYVNGLRAARPHGAQR
jgi:hypothetical protein